MIVKVNCRGEIESMDSRVTISKSALSKVNKKKEEEYADAPDIDGIVDEVEDSTDELVEEQKPVKRRTRKPKKVEVEEALEESEPNEEEK